MTAAFGWLCVLCPVVGTLIALGYLVWPRERETFGQWVVRSPKHPPEESTEERWRKIYARIYDLQESLARTEHRADVAEAKLKAIRMNHLCNEGQRPSYAPPHGLVIVERCLVCAIIGSEEFNGPP